MEKCFDTLFLVSKKHLVVLSVYPLYARHFALTEFPRKIWYGEILGIEQLDYCKEGEYGQAKPGKDVH